jgi:hypothetical protein
VILLLLDSFTDVASHQLDNEYLLRVGDLVGVVDDQRETVCDDFLLRKDRARLLRDRFPILCVDLS